jgi:hypothetical protein
MSQHARNITRLWLRSLTPIAASIRGGGCRVVLEGVGYIGQRRTKVLSIILSINSS